MIVAKASDLALLAQIEELHRENAALREALQAVEAHHVEQNAIKGRDEARSTTLRLIRAALNQPQREDPSVSMAGEPFGDPHPMDVHLQGRG